MIFPNKWKFDKWDMAVYNCVSLNTFLKLMAYIAVALLNKAAAIYI